MQRDIIIIPLSIIATIFVAILIPYIYSAFYQAEPDPWTFTDVNEMLNDEFTNLIVEPHSLCLVLNLKPAVCKTIEKDYSKIHRQVQEILNTWHETFYSLDKRKVYDALMSTRNVKCAREFSERHKLHLNSAPND